MARFLIFLIPILTFIVPMRWFSFYATLVIAAAAYVVFMLTVLNDASAAAFAEFGIELVLAYLAANLALLAVRYWLIRRARARILKLPAPKE